MELRGEDQEAIEHRINHATTYLGVPTRKLPMDAWVYQEIVHELRPHTIVEVGNHEGGTLLYLAHLCDLVGRGRVIGVDLNHDRISERTRGHGRVRLVTGDALDVFPAVDKLAPGHVLVIEDSAHTTAHTLAVMRTYGQLVQPGGYMIVEDGVMPPVAKAIATFVGEQSAFVADRAREWPLTWNPSGYLRRVA